MLQASSSNSPRASIWEWAQTALLGANLAWTTLCLGGYRADTMVVTVGLTAAMLMAHAMGRAIAADAVTRLHPAGWWLVPFVLYALAHVLWITPVPWRGWLDWLGWAEMAAIFWVVLNGVRSRWPRRVVFFTLVVLGLLGVVFACYQRFIAPDWLVMGQAAPGALGGRATGPFGIANSFAGFLLLLLPAVGALCFRRHATPTERTWWGWVAAVLLLGLLLTISRGGWMSLALALTAWPLFAARGGWSRRLRAALLVLMIVGAAGAAIYWKSPKVRARFASLVMNSGEVTRPFMWRGAWELFREAPVLGTGAGSYNMLFERHRRIGFRDEPLWAHNEYLNTLSDYGIVGWMLWFGAAAAIAGRCLFSRIDEAARRRDWLESPLVLSGLGVGVLAFAFQMALDFHLKIPALAFAFATVAGLVVPRRWPAAANEPPAKPSRSFAAVTIALAASFTVLLVPKLRSEGLRYQARRAIDRLGSSRGNTADYGHQLPAIRAELTAATALDPRNGQAWADLAYATTLAALPAPEATATLGREAEKLADRAIGVSPVCHEFWLRRGVARDMQARWLDASKDFAKAVELAPHDALSWYYYADHLSRSKWAREPALAAAEFCLRLDPGNSAALALCQRLAIKPANH